MIKNCILELLFPGYEEAIDVLESYSKYELEIIKDSGIETLDDIQMVIIKEIQYNILNTVFSRFIINWEEFFETNEEFLIDYCQEHIFIHYDNYTNSYELDKDSIINACEDFLTYANSDKYFINEDADIVELILELNNYFPIKFCLV